MLPEQNVGMFGGNLYVTLALLLLQHHMPCKVPHTEISSVPSATATSTALHIGKSFDLSNSGIVCITEKLTSDCISVDCMVKDKKQAHCVFALQQHALFEPAAHAESTCDFIWYMISLT